MNQTAGDSASNLPSQPLKRRGLLIGAGAAAAGAAAVLAAKGLPGTAPPAAVATVPKGVASDGGYQLTEHVRRYYETARA